MAAKHRTIERKDEYWDCTPKMKAIIDAIAENPDASDAEIADIASQNLDDDTVSRAYVPVVRQKQSHIIERQQERKANERTEGEVKTTGDPFEGLEKMGGGWQTLDQRPVQDTSDASNGSEGDSSTNVETTLTVELDRAGVQALLESRDIPEETKQEIMHALFDRAF